MVTLCNISRFFLTFLSASFTIVNHNCESQFCHILIFRWFDFSVKGLHTHTILYYHDCFIHYGEVIMGCNPKTSKLTQPKNTVPPSNVALFPLMLHSILPWITWEPMVRLGWNFACTNICTFLGLSQIFDALPGFFFAHRVKKKPGRASKILGNLTVGADIGTCKISAKSDNLVTSWAKQQGSGQRHRAALYDDRGLPTERKRSLLEQTIDFLPTRQKK